ncbi:MAG TPA: hypothetical protein VGU68_15630 [Ktedonobacteraceae bacterium]|nr:hypothetical protein [Ktedonobacteraceae bacterium]
MSTFQQEDKASLASGSHEEKSPLSHDLIIAEFTALRDEVTKLTDLQHQLFSIALLSFATLMGAGIQFKITPLLLIYPILAVFLNAAWFNHAYGIDMLGHYIQNHIENKVGTENIGWENHSHKNSIPHSILAFLGARGIFPATQVIALIAAVSLGPFNMLLFLTALLSTLICITFVIAIAWAQRKRNRLTKISQNKGIH